jgi:hypothetical protein
MIWLVTRPIVWPVKAGAYGVSAGYKTGRLVGYRRLTVFLLGVAVGLLVAPVPGAQLRARLRERLMPDSEPIALPPVRRERTPAENASTIDLTVPE